MSDKLLQPLGRKNYGSIPHLPCSRTGPADKSVNEGQARIATIKVRDAHDRVIVTEKLDGSNVGVALVNGQILALQRKGYLAWSSPFRMHHLFADWVQRSEDRWRSILGEGDRIVGEWLAQAHGTRYALPHEPFVAFDLMAGDRRLAYDSFTELMSKVEAVTPHLLSDGPAFSVANALAGIEVSGHGAIDPVEGAVWRVERKGEVDFLCKYVRPEKIDGCFLPGVSDCKEPVWNWQPNGGGA